MYLLGELSVSNEFALGLHVVVLQPSHVIAGKATFYRESTQTDRKEGNGQEYGC